MNSSIDFIVAIRSARTALGWNQQEFADKMGISKTTIARIETMEVAPKPEFLTKAISLFKNSGITIYLLSINKVTLVIENSAISEAHDRLNLITNQVMTPDGTVLQSFNRHDYKKHVDAITGETYMVDGGLEYIRRNVNKVPAKEMSAHDNAPFVEVRQGFVWGTRGKDGRQPLKYVTLCDLDSDHIESILETHTQVPPWMRRIFEKEIKFRQDSL
jgi:transcriptional regulator with XRE-family HTH domain